jgi:hypothetical protein
MSDNQTGFKSFPTMSDNILTDGDFAAKAYGYNAILLGKQLATSAIRNCKASYVSAVMVI